MTGHRGAPPPTPSLGPQAAGRNPGIKLDSRSAGPEPAAFSEDPWVVVGGKDASPCPGREPEALTLLCAPSGLSFCQLQRQQILLRGYVNSTATSYLPQCQDSGEYAPVQCDPWRGQCWCVDAEGMEVYGTRQPGRPTRCKCQGPQRCTRAQRVQLSTRNRDFAGPPGQKAEDLGLSTENGSILGRLYPAHISTHVV